MLLTLCLGISTPAPLRWRASNPGAPRRAILPPRMGAENRMASHGLLYEGWGKNLTTILAFDAYARAPSVADVTGDYTSDLDGALRRREAEVTPARFGDLIRDANAELLAIGREPAVTN